MLLQPSDREGWLAVASNMTLDTNHRFLMDEVAAIHRELWGGGSAGGVTVSGGASQADDLNDLVSPSLGEGARGGFIGSEPEQREGGLGRDESFLNNLRQRRRLKSSLSNQSFPSNPLPGIGGVGVGGGGQQPTFPASVKSMDSGRSLASPTTMPTSDGNQHYKESFKESFSYAFRCCSATAHSAQLLAEHTHRYEKLLLFIQQKVDERLHGGGAMQEEERKARGTVIEELSTALAVVQEAHKGLEALKLVFTNEVIAQKQVLDGEHDGSSPLRWKVIPKKQNLHFDPTAENDASLEMLTLIGSAYEWGVHTIGEGQSMSPMRGSMSSAEIRENESSFHTLAGHASRDDDIPLLEEEEAGRGGSKGRKDGSADPEEKPLAALKGQTGSTWVHVEAERDPPARQPFYSPDRENLQQSTSPHNSPRSTTSVNHPLLLAEVELVGETFAKLQKVELDLQQQMQAEREKVEKMPASSASGRPRGLTFGGPNREQQALIAQRRRPIRGPIRFMDQDIRNAIYSYLVGCLALTPSTILLGIAPTEARGIEALNRIPQVASLVDASQARWRLHPLVRCLLAFLHRHYELLECEWQRLASVPSWQQLSNLPVDAETKAAAGRYNEERVCLIDELSLQWIRKAFEERQVPFVLDPERQAEKNNEGRGRANSSFTFFPGRKNGDSSSEPARTPSSTASVPISVSNVNPSTPTMPAASMPIPLIGSPVSALPPPTPSNGDRTAFSGTNSPTSGNPAVLDLVAIREDVVPKLLDDSLEKLTMSCFLFHSAVAKNADEVFLQQCVVRAESARELIRPLLSLPNGQRCPVRQQCMDSVVAMLRSDFSREAVMVTLCRRQTIHGAVAIQLKRLVIAYRMVESIATYVQPQIEACDERPWLFSDHVAQMMDAETASMAGVGADTTFPLLLATVASAQPSMLCSWLQWLRILQRPAKTEAAQFSKYSVVSSGLEDYVVATLGAVVSAISGG
jgi:hypothetical protein